MALSLEQVNKIAHLARLQLASQESDALTHDLNNILGLVDQLQAASTAGIEPMAHPLDAVQLLRADVVTESNQRERFQAIAPAVQEGCYLVPRVVE